MSGEGTTLSHRAEIFRSKLIEDFQILESTSEQGKRKVPIYSSTDITGIILGTCAGIKMRTYILAEVNAGL